MVMLVIWDGDYLNQWWLVYQRIYASLGLNELTRNNYGKPSNLQQLIVSTL